MGFRAWGLGFRAGGDGDVTVTMTMRVLRGLEHYSIGLPIMVMPKHSQNPVLVVM